MRTGQRNLFWHCWRQGRWILIGGLAFSMVSGVLIYKADGMVRFAIWPITSMLLGLAAGLAVFILDQNKDRQLLSAHHYSPGRIWSIKLLFWAVAACLFVLLSGFVEIALHAVHEHGISHTRGLLTSARIRRELSWLAYDGYSDLPLWLGLWPIYGFCVGQCIGLLSRRPFVAVILAIAVTIGLLALWFPSVYIGGVPLWQTLVIPALLLITTRLAIRQWLEERHFTRWPLGGIFCAIVLMSLSMAGSLYYRAVQVPELGEPFDVAAYRESLPSAEQNVAGRLLRHAVSTYAEHRRLVDNQASYLQRVVSPQEYGFDREAMSRQEAFQEVLDHGWPENDGELARWLNQMLASEWVEEVSAAVRFPPGMLEDPRTSHLTLFGSTLSWDCTHMGLLLVARAHQLQAGRDAPRALDHLEQALRLAAHMKQDAPQDLFRWAVGVEQAALGGLRLWLQKLGPEKALLGRALDLLKEHEASTQDPANNLKATYVQYQNGGPRRAGGTSLVWRLGILSNQVPWEEVRQARMVRALIGGALRRARAPIWQALTSTSQLDLGTSIYTRRAVECALPPAGNGPGSGLSAEEWGSLIEGSGAWNHGIGLQDTILSMTAQSLESLRATKLVAAVALYDAEQRHLPASLGDLVPGYLPDLPINPYTGAPFEYWISRGEEVDNAVGMDTELAPGQAYIKGRPHGWGYSSRGYPVPTWAR